MNIKKQSTITVSLLCGMLLSSTALSAQEVIKKDSVANDKEVKNRNVMLNASSADQPRQISIGLPAATTGATIFEDGLPVSYNPWPDIPYLSWTGGNGYSRIRVMSLGEAALQYGGIAYAVNSFTADAGKQLGGKLTYQLNNYGRQVFDGVVSGPLGKGWGLMVNTRQIWDPGTSKITAASLQRRVQAYRFKLSKSFAKGRGYMSLLYQFTSNMSNTSTASPFIFVGDGSVKKYNGIDFGTDPYFPQEANTISYRDDETGKIITKSWRDGGTTRNNQITYNFNYNFRNGMKFDFTSRAKFGNVNQALSQATGISKNSGRYFYADGTPYTGDYVQNRYLMVVPGFERTWFNTAMLSGKSKNAAHNWRIGLNIWYNRAGTDQASTNSAHEVAKDPHLLYVKDSNGLLQSATGLNAYGGAYYDTHDSKFALILSDDWKVNKRLNLNAGVRLEYNTYAGKSATTMNGKENPRINNWWVGANPNGGITHFHGDWLNPSATFNFRYSILKGFGLTGEYVFVMQRTVPKDYSGAAMPRMKPVDINAAHGGIFWNNKWISLTSQLSYVSSTNYKTRSSFYHQLQNDATDGSGLLKGDEQSVTITTNYDVHTIGWTTDFVLTPFRGFALHGLLTLQKPTYQNLDISATFADGVTDHADVSGKVVTAMSKVLIELDPSYNYKKWSVGLNFRYFGKQYINKTNTLYFNGHWETFGNIRYQLNKKINFALNVVNFLNQNGASGSISSADLVTDPSKYKNYLMAGSYIRPFEVSLSTTINF